MDFFNLDTFTAWATAHPFLAGLIVFIQAFAESLAVVGLFMPGTIFMFIIGALISLGALPLWPTLSWAVAGAIAGDGVSFWLGYRYQDQITRIWPLSRYPELLQRGRTFFNRHGGKGIVFGRFIGPIRPMIPVIAGTCRMPIHRFLFTNILSALCWAPIYMLPGMAFGLSLDMASEVAGRLAMLILLLLALIVVVVLLLQRLYKVLVRRIDVFTLALLRWSRRHPLTGALPDSVLLRDHPEVRALSVYALLLIGSSLLLGFVSGHGGPNSLLGNLDLLLQNEIGLLETAPVDHMMYFLSQFASPLLLFGVVVFTSIWLGLYRHWQAVAHLQAAWIVPVILLISQTHLLAGAAPLTHSGYATLPVAIYGFLAVLLARESRLSLHRWAYSFFTLVIITAGLSQLYLGLLPFSLLIGGLLLGLAWIAVLGIAYRRHSHETRVPPRSVLLWFGLLALLEVVYAASHTMPPPLHTVRQSTTPISASYWNKEGWRQLPAMRDDLRHHDDQPFNLQIASDKSTLRQFFTANHWRPCTGLSLTTSMQWLAPSPDVMGLPILSQVHADRYQAACYSKQEHPDSPLLVVRLWRSGYSLKRDTREIPIWVGNISQLATIQLGMMSYLRTNPDYTGLTEYMQTGPTSWQAVIRQRELAQIKSAKWKGRVVLIAPRDWLSNR